MKLTARIVNYIASEEGIVAEAYKDSKGIWTWGMGVTNASGHEVYPRYKDKVQTLDKCLKVSIWLLEKKYLPAVVEAFPQAGLTDAQVAAALSFHWNTGAIGRAQWVKLWNAGSHLKAAEAFKNWPEPRFRRKRERDLFFQGIWPQDQTVPLWEVNKRSYKPMAPRPVDLMPVLEAIFGGK